MTDEADADVRPLLGVVPPSPEMDAAERFNEAAGGIRAAAAWTDGELARLRAARKAHNAEVAEAAKRAHADAMAKREAINAQIRVLVASRARYEKLLRVLDLDAEAGS
jgi:DNA-directed RNA polymerase sigma subunit (sigma70/sigma32)